MVERPAVPQRRHDAEPDADHGDQHEGGAGQHQRARRSPPQTSGATGRFISVDSPRSPRQEAARPAQILLPDRVGQAELQLQRPHLLRAARRPEDQIGDVRRQQRRDREDEHRHRDEHQHDEDEPSRDVGGHRCSSSPPQRLERDTLFSSSQSMGVEREALDLLAHAVHVRGRVGDDARARSPRRAPGTSRTAPCGRASSLVLRASSRICVDARRPCRARAAGSSCRVEW